MRSKNDMMCLNNQLLEAIQRKLELSQELEAWQVGHWGSISGSISMLPLQASCRMMNHHKPSQTYSLSAAAASFHDLLPGRGAGTDTRIMFIMLSFTVPQVLGIT